MRDHDYWVYIVTNKGNTTLCIGMTNDLTRRMGEHRAGQVKGFTQHCHLNRLVWFEHFRDVRDAIACEKKLKGWLRAKKLALIAEKNPRWMDFERGLLRAGRSGRGRGGIPMSGNHRVCFLRNFPPPPALKLRCSSCRVELI